MTQSAFWIIHREPALRAALERMASPFGAVLALDPGSPEILEALPPDLVLLGVGGAPEHLEAELEAAHRLRERAPRVGWILVGEPAHLRRAQALFAGLGARLLAFPPTAVALEEILNEPTAAPAVASLRERSARDRLAERFALWFEGIEIPGILRSLDPTLAHLPILAQGEPGSGRRLVARYVQHFSDPEGAPTIAIHCAGIDSREELLQAIAGSTFDPGTGASRGRRRIAILLEEVHELPDRLQHLVADWIEFSAPPAPLPERVRWLVTAGPVPSRGGSHPRLAERLRDVLGPLALSLPALREAPGRSVRFAESFTRSWAHEHSTQARPFAASAREFLQGYPWPGNLRELEGTLRRVLVLDAGATIGADALFRATGQPPAKPSDLALPDPATPPDAAPLRWDGSTPTDSWGNFHDPPAEGRADGGGSSAGLLRLAGSIAHEVRNPLVSIRTFAELLEDNYADPDFRERFASIVRSDVGRIEDVVGRLQAIAESDGPSEDTGPRPVDLPRLVTSILNGWRNEVAAREILIIEELDAEGPFVLAEPEPLRAALSGLIERAVSQVPDRGDVYLASHRNEAGLGGKPALRLLLRYQHRLSSTGPASDVLARSRSDGEAHELSESANASEFAFAEAVVRAQAGAFTLDTTDPSETVLVIDLPAASVTTL